MAAALMERRGQTVGAMSIYEEVVARFPADDAGQRAAARLSELRPAPDLRLSSRGLTGSARKSAG
ncbi:MAG: hypothetical protein ACHQM4_01635 [Thermoanaerobaculia bacterium]